MPSGPSKRPDPMIASRCPPRRFTLARKRDADYATSVGNVKEAEHFFPIAFFRKSVFWKKLFALRGARRVECGSLPS